MPSTKSPKASRPAEKSQPAPFVLSDRRDPHRAASAEVPFAVLRGAPAPGPFAPVVLPDVSPDFSTANSQVADSSADHQYELGLTTAAMSYHTAAIDALRQCTTLAPDHAPAYRKLAELLRLSGEDQAADAAEAAASTCRDVKWEPAADRRTFGQLQKAERKLLEHLKELPEEDAAMRLREHLIANPLDAIAMRWLARLEARAGDLFTARALFRRALDLCPTYIGARREYCELLVEERDSSAIEETGRLLEDSSDQPQSLFMHAHALLDNGKADAAIGVLTELLKMDSNNAQYWSLYGNALRVSGRREEAIQAYRKCLQVQPEMGQAWWNLAELKDKVLTQGDVAEMRGQLEEHGLPSESRMAIFYALGQTLERAGDYAESFAAYEAGAREFWAIKGARAKDREAMEDTLHQVQRLKAVFSRENLASTLKQAPIASPDVPIFVVGMPRAGSTLVEQILASHSQVEGIGERALIGDLKRDLGRSRMLVTPNAYPECLLELDEDRLASLGARVLAESRRHRATDRVYFVDKRPWNWLDVGLIHLILPQAKIIDVRREPMAACFAMYKQMLPQKSCEFSYDFKRLGAYYNRYVDLMEHWRSVLPGRVHSLQYERLVEDTEGEIRRMLDYCGLPFEENCLRFWELDRAIVTPSAEQVRRPIYRQALEQWRNFDPWLGPLKEALAAPLEA